MSFFQGLFAIVLTIIGRFGVTNKVYDLASLYNYEYVEQFLKIFPNQRYNAFVSMFFAFYLDFRYFGVFIGSFMFGLLISYSYKFAKKGNLLSMSYFLLMMQALVKSFVRWEFVVGPYCFAFIIIIYPMFSRCRIIHILQFWKNNNTDFNDRPFGLLLSNWKSN